MILVIFNLQGPARRVTNRNESKMVLKILFILCKLKRKLFDEIEQEMLFLETGGGGIGISSRNRGDSGDQAVILVIHFRNQ